MKVKRAVNESGEAGGALRRISKPVARRVIAASSSAGGMSVAVGFSR